MKTPIQYEAEFFSAAEDKWKTPTFETGVTGFKSGDLFNGASGDTELFRKASNINGFQGERAANNLYIRPSGYNLLQNTMR